MIHVIATVGIGGWKASYEADLVACPHVGDMIEVNGVTVVCERVYITSKAVYVEETRRFQTEAEAQDYFKE